jgi:hypothetical protein
MQIFRRGSRRWLFLILLVSIAAGFIYQFAPYESNWLPAFSVFDKNRFTQIVDDNALALRQGRKFSELQDHSLVKFLRPWAAPELAIIDFSTKDVCGLSGCLYAIYETPKPRHPIFRWLLHSKNLPTNTPLFKIENNCLVLNQFNQRQIVQLKFCYSAGSYTQTQQSYFN